MDNINCRLLEIIGGLETRRAQHETEARRLQGLVAKLTLLAEGEEDAELEAVLKALVNPPPVTPVEPPAPPPPPPVKRISVTADGIFAITQSFESLFEADNVVDVLMLRENVTDKAERMRVRSAVCSMLVKLRDNGRLRQMEAGSGRRRAKFHRITVTASHPAPPFKNGAPAAIEVARC